MFGCPIWKVGEIVPAAEMPLWHAHFSSEPWGFSAQDMLASKSAFQIAQTLGKVKSGANYTDFMFKDRFDTGELTRDEFECLSEREKQLYIERQIRAAEMVLN